jgi:hypothetical protein
LLRGGCSRPRPCFAYTTSEQTGAPGWRCEAMRYAPLPAVRQFAQRGVSGGRMIARRPTPMSVSGGRRRRRRPLRRDGRARAEPRLILLQPEVCRARSASLGMTLFDPWMRSCNLRSTPPDAWHRL